MLKNLINIVLYIYIYNNIILIFKQISSLNNYIYIKYKNNYSYLVYIQRNKSVIFYNSLKHSNTLVLSFLFNLHCFSNKTVFT